MGWSIGYDSNWDRDIGYGVPAYCDHPKCKKKIDRGLAHVCGGEEPYGGEGCGLYFCSAHLFGGRLGFFYCKRCQDDKEPFKPKKDHPQWIKHKLRNESWEKWRDENPEKVKKLRKFISPVSNR